MALERGVAAGDETGAGEGVVWDAGDIATGAWSDFLRGRFPGEGFFGSACCVAGVEDALFGADLGEASSGKRKRSVAISRGISGVMAWRISRRAR